MATPSGRTDLSRLVDTLCDASIGEGVPPRPWLDPLPDIVDAGAMPTSADRFAVPFALVDRPDHQRQEVDRLDLAMGGGVLVCGGPRSGRSSALRTIAARAAELLTPAQIHLHVIDCAGGALRELGGLTHCGSLLERHDPSAIDQLVRRIGAEIADRQAKLADSGVGNAVEARAAGHQVSSLVLLIDGWEGFLAASEDADAGRGADALLQILRDAPGTGVTVIITGDRACLGTRLSSAVQRRMVLRLSDAEDYPLAGVPRRLVPGRMPPGRALAVEDGLESQIAVLGGDPCTAAQVRYVQRVAAATMPIRAGLAPFSVRSLPRRVSLKELPVAVRPLGAILGVGGDDAVPVRISLAGRQARFLVAGPARSGRSTLLVSLATQLTSQGVRVLAAAPARSPLHDWASGTRAGAIATPDSASLDMEPPATGSALSAGDASGSIVVLVDDSEQFLDTELGHQIVALIRVAPAGLSIFASGRSDELAVAYRGIGAELRRSRSGLLLQPGAGDGDLFGVRLPYRRHATPPGRGYLIADELVDPVSPTGPGPISIQVAAP